jgi:hypothetical protein
MLSMTNPKVCPHLVTVREQDSPSERRPAALAISNIKSWAAIRS